MNIKSNYRLSKVVGWCEPCLEPRGEHHCIGQHSLRLPSWNLWNRYQRWTSQGNNSFRGKKKLLTSDFFQVAVEDQLNITNKQITIQRRCSRHSDRQTHIKGRDKFNKGIMVSKSLARYRAFQSWPTTTKTCKAGAVKQREGEREWWWKASGSGRRIQLPTNELRRQQFYFV